MSAQDVVALIYGVAAFVVARGAMRRQAAADHPCPGRWLTWTDGRMHACSNAQGHDTHRVARKRWCRCRCGARFPAISALPHDDKPAAASADCDGCTNPVTTEGQSA